MKDIKVTAVRFIPGAKPEKGQTYCGIRYSVPCFLTVDGKEYRSTCDARLKRDVAGNMQQMERNIQAGAMSACFNDEGKFWGTSTTYTIGAAGMVPTAE